MHKMKKENIYLVGFMGSGKTTLSYELSKLLGYKRIDMDKEIAEVTQESIPHIFATKGECYFREIESKVLFKTDNMKQSVIATGGGTIGQVKNREFLSKRICIYLEWPFEMLYQRIKNDPNRPLARNEKELKELFENRSNFYQEVASYVVQGSGKTPREIAEEITKKLGGVR